jgi:hypothetical protein
MSQLCVSPEVGKFRPNTFRPLHNPFSRPVGYPVYTNKKCVIETGTLVLGRAGNNRCIGLDYLLTVTMKNTHLLHRSRKPSLSSCIFFFLCLYVCPILACLASCLASGCGVIWSDAKNSWSMNRNKRT